MHHDNLLPIHPRTGLTAVGVLPSGKPVWPILGASPDHPGDPDPEPLTVEGDSDPTPPGDTDPEPGGQPTVDPEPAAKGEKPGKQSLEDLPDWAQKVVRDARKGEADRRAAQRAAETKAAEAEAQRQQTLDQIAKALGLAKDDAPADPEQLTQQLAEAQAVARQREVELAVFKTADKHEARPDRLLDSREFINGVKKLDPSASDFGDRISESIQAALEADPDRFKAAAASAPAPKPPTRSGGEFTGAPGGTKPITREQLTKMSPDEVQKAFEEGRLDHLR